MNEPARPDDPDDLGIRSLNTRSVLLSALLGTHPPELPVAALISLADAFGIPAGTVRTALSRMASNGEVTSTDGRYRLAGRLVERQREQDRGRVLPPADWDGTWWSATTVGGRRRAAERRRFRAAMLAARMGELRSGVWMRPANIDPPTIGAPTAVDADDRPRPRTRTADGDDRLLDGRDRTADGDDRLQAVVVRGDLAEGDPVALAGRLWDLEASERHAERLRAALGRATDALTSGDDSAIAPAFSTFAACLRFLRSEPQLPTELAPSPAAGSLRADYERAEPLLQSRLRALIRRPPT